CAREPTERWVEDIDVDRHVRRAGNGFVYDGDGVLDVEPAPEHLGVTELSALLQRRVGERGTAQPDLNAPGRGDHAFLDGTPDDRSGGLLRPPGRHVRAGGGVEVYEPQWPVHGRGRAHQRQSDRVVATDAHDVSVFLPQGGRARFDCFERTLR